MESDEFCFYLFDGSFFDLGPGGDWGKIAPIFGVWHEKFLFGMESHVIVIFDEFGLGIWEVEGREIGFMVLL